MRLTLLSVAALVVLASAALWGTAQTGQSPLPQPTGYVNDFAGVIDAATKQSLEQSLINLDRQQQMQFAVVTVDTTNGQDIFDYSLAVARGWGIGSKDVQKPSLLLLVAIKDRRYFTQVSRHLEGDLPDGLVGQIQRERLVPPFREGKYGQGLQDTIDAYISTVAEKRGFSTDTIFGSSHTPAPQASRTSRTNVCPTIIVLFVIVLVVLIILRRGGSGGFRGGGGGWWVWLLINALLNSGRGSSGWSRGGFGGYSGGSSGGFGGGGFGGFGGGGDFGGGGSGGSW